ncbi:MAG: hypothetical protein QW594_04655 [Candidatus Woesearchaeota archaeon]
MNEIIKQDVLTILKEAQTAIDRADLLMLEELSNKINHNSSIFQDKDSISLAVAIYALFKIFSREQRIDKELTRILQQAYFALEKNDEERYLQQMQALLNAIEKKDQQLRYYIHSVLEKAGIKKGTKLYYNGISLARVAEVMGLTQWDIITYVGKTNLAETFQKTPHVPKRLALTRKLFQQEPSKTS